MSVVYLAATCIGGDSLEDIFDMAVDAADRIYVAGYSMASGLDGAKQFPVTSGAYDTAPAPEYQKKAVVSGWTTT